MNWSKDALLSKAKLYFTKAFEEEKDSPFFGIFCALGLELLARAALANISPTLLADNANAQGNILYASIHIMSHTNAIRKTNCVIIQIQYPT